MSEATALHPVAGLWHAFDRREWDAARPFLAPDFVADWPQTSERIAGPDAFLALNAAYPGEWRCRLLELVALGERAAARVLVTDGSVRFHVMGLYKLEDGCIKEAVEVFGDEMEPPFDRSQWASRYPRLG